MSSLHPCVYKDESLEIYLEETDVGLWFIHCYSRKWNMKAYKHYLNVFAELMYQLGEKGITNIYAAIDNPKLEKFASMFGFIEDNWSVVDSTGKEREVWLWSKQQQQY